MKRLIIVSIFILIGLIFVAGYFSHKENQIIEKSIQKEIPSEVDWKIEMAARSASLQVKKPSSVEPEKVTSTSFERKSWSMGITIGTPADKVLAIRGKGISVEVIGKDFNGLIVEWEYRDGIYVMRRYEINGVDCYRVSKMKL